MAELRVARKAAVFTVWPFTGKLASPCRVYPRAAPRNRTPAAHATLQFLVAALKESKETSDINFHDMSFNPIS